MQNTVPGRFLLFILLIILQITLFDKIHLFGFATPLLYIYFILKLPGNMNRILVLFLSAILGLSIDWFSHTLGINMLACVVIGFFRSFLLNWLTPRDLVENYSLSFSTFGVRTFLRYAFITTLIHHTILFTTEYLSFFDPLALIFRITGSVILTVILIFACESINLGVSRR